MVFCFGRGCSGGHLGIDRVGGLSGVLAAFGICGGQAMAACGL